MAVPVRPQAEALTREIELENERGRKPVGNVYYGTSSWTDPTLLKSKAFYPPDAGNPEKRLRYYSEHFPLVEVDATFYALPSERNAALWAERTPDHFVFNVKAFGLMTHHAVQHEVAARADPRDAARGRRVQEAACLSARPAAGRA